MFAWFAEEPLVRVVFALCMNEHRDGSVTLEPLLACLLLFLDLISWVSAPTSAAMPYPL